MLGRIQKKIKRIIYLFSTIDVFKTISLNFKVFPSDIAKMLPIFVGKNVDINEVYKGCIQFQEGIEIKRGMVSFGICPIPMVSNKSLITLLRISPNAKLILSDNIRIYTGCSVIVTYKGVMSIGSDFLMNQKARLYCANSVSIGSHCRIGWETQVYDSNFHFMYDSINHCIGNAMGTISLGHNVWVGNRCTISKGASIPNYGIIGGNSLVSKELTNKFGGGIWVGMPVSLIREGFYRILDDGYQYELFCHFQETGERFIESQLSEEKLNHLLHLQ